MPAIITLEELQQHLQQTTTYNGFLTSAANADIDDAEAAVNVYCERFTNPWTAQTVPVGVKLIVKRIAARLFTNPQQRSSYTGPDGLNYSGGPVRLLTDDEREGLDPYKPSKKKVGTVRMAAAPWMVPEYEPPGDTV